MKNVVTFGGGSGHAQILRGLKNIKGIKITAICPGTDSGGSTGILSRDYGTLGYLGDLTKCIAALSPDEDLANALMHRFGEGCLNGHSVKNILFLGLEKQLGFSKALKTMHQICGLSQHQVVPVTTERTELCAVLTLGNEVRGEMNIDNISANHLWHPHYHEIQNVYLDPQVSASAGSIEAINKADCCIICPGDLYSSILPTLLPRGIKEALVKKSPQITIVLNIMTKKDETRTHRAEDFIAKVEKYIGLPIKTVVCHSSVGIESRLLGKYNAERKFPLIIPETIGGKKVHPAHLLEVNEKGNFHHNSERVASVFKDLL